MTENSFENIYETAFDIIEFWSNKTQRDHGIDLKSINQNLITQIQNIYQDEETLIKKTQLNRKKLKIIGENKINEYCEQIYDDHDFYQQLLRQIIANKNHTNTATKEDLELKKLLKKQEKNIKKLNQIDRRASKGRKIRFEYLPKLQNFMVPVARYDADFLTDQLFSNLFAK